LDSRASEVEATRYYYDVWSDGPNYSCCYNKIRLRGYNAGS
jgi:hypothetical protein